MNVIVKPSLNAQDVADIEHVVRRQVMLTIIVILVWVSAYSLIYMIATTLAFSQPTVVRVKPYDTAWADHNELIREACVQAIVETAPDDITSEMAAIVLLDCRVNNGVFF